MFNPYQAPEELYPDDDANDRDEHEGPDYDEAREYWPACPECGKRLTITCPFCKTTDDLFPLGDTEYWDDDLGGSLVEYQHRLDRRLASRSVLFGEGDTSIPLDEHGCSCHKMGKMPNELYGGSPPELSGGQGCCNHRRDDDNVYNDDDFNDDFNDDDNSDFDDDDFDEPERAYDRESLPFVVVCPTCSEAFIPSFPGGCRHCRYIWDRTQPVDLLGSTSLSSTAEQANHARRSHSRITDNPALREPGGFSLPQCALIAVVLAAVMIVVIKLLMTF